MYPIRYLGIFCSSNVTREMPYPMCQTNNNNNNKQTFQNAKLTLKVAQARAVAITKYMLISVKQIN